METQRKDVKNLLYSRRLLMTMMMMMTHEAEFTSLLLASLQFYEAIGWMLVSSNSSISLYVNVSVDLYLAHHR